MKLADGVSLRANLNQVILARRPKWERGFAALAYVASMAQVYDESAISELTGIILDYGGGPGDEGNFTANLHAAVINLSHHDHIDYAPRVGLMMEETLPRFDSGGADDQLAALRVTGRLTKRLLDPQGEPLVPLDALAASLSNIDANKLKETQDGLLLTQAMGEVTRTIDEVETRNREIKNQAALESGVARDFSMAGPRVVDLMPAVHRRNGTALVAGGAAILPTPEIDS